MSDTPPSDSPTPDDLAAKLAAAEARLAQIQQESAVYKQTLETLQHQRAAQPATPPADLGFDAALVAAYRRQGFSDDEIRRNLEIMAPVLDYAGRQIGSVMQQQRAEIERLQAATDRTRFKHWDLLRDAVSEEQKKAQQIGIPLDIERAYAVAFANNYEKVQAAEAAQAQASASARDVGAQRHLVSPTTQVVREDPLTVASAREIEALPPSEQQKVWDALANRPF